MTQRTIATYCLLHPDRFASTLVHKMPVCLNCCQAYQAEAAQHLPYRDRLFYLSLVAARDGGQVAV
jgi:uncharacterized membrane protein